MKAKTTKITGIILTLVMLVTILGVFTLSASAAEVAGGTTGDVSWTLTDDGTLTFSGEGAMADYSNGSQPWYAYKDSIKTVIITKGVTSISTNAFREFSALATVKIAGSVTAIGSNAFYSCTKLSTVEYYGSSNPVADSTVFFGSYFVAKVPSSYSGTVFCEKMARATLDAANEPLPPCDHPGVDIATGNCTACGEFAAVANLAVPNDLFYFATLENAITVAQSADGSTITLLEHRPILSSNINSGNFTIDLNGKTLSSSVKIYGGNITLFDDNADQSLITGAITVYAGTLTIDGGEYLNYVQASSGGNLIIENGSFYKVHLNLGTMTVKGGKFDELRVSSGTGTLATVLPKDYYIYDENGDIVDVGADNARYEVFNVTVEQGADLSTEAVITVEKATYNGTEQKPTVTVTVGGVKLVQGTDFNVDYPSDYDFIDVGNYAISVEGIGNYTGRVNLPYIIEKATLEEADFTVGNTNPTYAYDSTHEVAVLLPVGLDAQYVKVVYSQGGTILTDLPKNAGTYDVSISVVGSPNYNDAFFQNKWQLVIEPKEAIVTVGALGTEEYFFNGYPHTPTVFLNLGVLPAPSTEFEGCTVTYENNTQVGTAKVIVGGNYKGEATFVIQKGKPTIGLTSPLDKVMPGYVLTLTPTTNAIDNSYYTTTFTIEDGDGYSVDGFKITIDSGVAVNDVITIKVKSTETETYQAATGELKLTVGVPVVDTSELENDIKELNNLIESKADADDIAQKLTDITDRIQALEAIKEAYKDADAALKTELEGTIADAKTELNGAVSKLETKLGEEVTKLQNQIDSNDTDIDGIKTQITAIDGLIDALEAADVALDGKITDAIDKAKTELDDAVSKLETKLGEEVTKLQNQIDSNDTDIDGIKTQITTIDGLIDALEAADVALDGKITDAINKAKTELDSAKAELEKRIEGVQTNLDNAKSELDKAIADLEKAMKKGDEDLSAALAKLNVELINAKVILEKADAENKAELVKKIEDADKVLDDAIKAVQKDLDDAKTALNKAIADGDTALDGKITALNEALATAKAALEATDAANKSELTNKIDEADKALQAAIDTLSNELSSVKQALENKDAELQTFIVIVCVISSVALCGSGAFVVWFFIDRKKRI